MRRLRHKPDPSERARSGVLLALPRTAAELDQAVLRARALVTRRAAVSCVASLVPLPGLDIAVDVAALTRLIPEINAEFGLTPEQISRLSAGRQLLVYRAIVAIGGVMIGKLVTREIAIEVLKSAGVRMTARQVGKYVPVAGQALSAALGFSAMKHVGHQHIRDCQLVVEKALAARS